MLKPKIKFLFTELILLVIIVRLLFGNTHKKQNTKNFESTENTTRKTSRELANEDLMRILQIVKFKFVFIIYLKTTK